MCLRLEGQGPKDLPTCLAVTATKLRSSCRWPTSTGASFHRAINAMGSGKAKTGLTVQIPELWLLLSLPALLGDTPTSGTFAAPGCHREESLEGGRPCSAHSLQRLHMKGAVAVRRNLSSTGAASAHDEKRTRVFGSHDPTPTPGRV